MTSGLCYEGNIFLIAFPFIFTLSCSNSGKANHAAQYKTIANANTQYRKFETNIPRKGIPRPQSQFHIHVSVSDSHDPSAYSAAGKYVD